MSGNIRPQSSQLDEPLWTDPGLKSGLSVRELISTSKKKKKRRKEKKEREKKKKERKKERKKRSEENATTTISVEALTGSRSVLGSNEGLFTDVRRSVNQEAASNLPTTFTFLQLVLSSASHTQFQSSAPRFKGILIVGWCHCMELCI